MNSLMLQLASKVNKLEKAITFDPSTFDTRAQSVFLWFSAQDRTAAEVDEYLAIDYNANNFTALLDSEETLVSFINDGYALSNAFKSDVASYRLLESPGAAGKIIAHRTPGLNPADWVDIYQIVESATAMPQMISSSSAMAIVADSGLALDAITANPAALAYLVSTTLALDAIIENAQGLELFVATPAAVSAVIADVVGRPHFIASNIAMAVVIDDAAALTQFSESSAAIDDIIADVHTVVQFSSNLVAMTSVINSEVMMPKFAASTSALDEIISDPGVLNLFIGSSVAISVLLEDIVGRPHFIASSVAISVLVTNKEALGLFIESQSAINETIANIEALDIFTSSPTAIGVIAESSVALIAFLSNANSGSKVTEKQANRDILTVSLSAMTTISANAEAMVEMTSDPTKTRDILASPYVLETIWQNQTSVQQLVDLNIISGESYKLMIDMTGVSIIKAWLCSPYNSADYNIYFKIYNDSTPTTLIDTNYIFSLNEYTIDISEKIRTSNDFILFYQDSSRYCQVANKVPSGKTGYSIEKHFYQTTDSNYTHSSYTKYGGQLWGLQLIKEDA